MKTIEPVERVMAVLKGTLPDRIPCGEFWLSPGHLLAGLGTVRPGPEEEIGLYRSLGIDARAFPARTITRCIIHPWVCDSGMALFGLVDGPIQRSIDRFGLLELSRMIMAGQGTEWLTEPIEAAVSDAFSARDAGCHGVIWADDVADSRGLLFPPGFLEEYFERVKGTMGNLLAEVPVLFHSDGQVVSLPGLVSEAGFRGLHSLDPTGGEQLGPLRQSGDFGLCLWGGIDDAVLLSHDRERVGGHIRQVLEAASGMAYVFGTSTGIVTEGVDLSILKESYALAKNWPVR